MEDQGDVEVVVSAERDNGICRLCLISDRKGEFTGIRRYCDVLEEFSGYQVCGPWAFLGIVTDQFVSL